MAAASKHGSGLSLFSSPAHLGLATGLLLSLLINSRIWTAKANKEVFGTRLPFGTPKPYQWILHLTPSSSFTFASTKTFILPYLYLLPLLAMILLLPILSALMAFLLPFAIYRFAIQIYLQYRSDTPFRKKLFSGADAVWTFNESYQSYSVINALIILEGEPQIDQLRDILSERLGSIPKLRMRHNITLGYATWYEDRGMDLRNLIQWIPGVWGNPHRSSSSVEAYDGHECLSHRKWNRKNLSKTVESLCNRPLPENHTVGWEALIGRAMPWDESDDDGEHVSSVMGNHKHQGVEDEGADPTVFPILFRVHHSVGDGASLLQLLMSALIDDNSTHAPAFRNNQSKANLTSISRPLTLNISPIEVDQNEVEMSALDFTHELPEKPNPTPNSKTHDCLERNATPGLKNASHQMGNSKESLAKPNTKSNSHLKNPSPKSSSASPEDKESSFLYGRKLSGNKTILWDSTSVTVEEIKKIRGATGVKFTEILLSAISAALSNYWDAREKGQVNDEIKANRKYSRRIKEGDKNWKDQSSESEDDWDQLKDVPEENEEECPRNENSLPTRCGKEPSPPTSVKLVLPAILGSIFQKQKDLTLKETSELENLFSVAVMTLPVGKSGGCPLERLSKVSDASGYMMPLRKDSIVECGKRLNFGKEELMTNVTDATKCRSQFASITHQELNNVSYTTATTPTGTSSCETAHDHPTHKEHSETASIKPNEPEVLTYYYTKQPDVQVKLAQGPDPLSKRGALVQYHRHSDSAKVILHEKEPYHCPTTIFFTQSNVSNGVVKSNSLVSNMNMESSDCNKVRNETADLQSCTVESPTNKTVKKTDIQITKTGDISRTTSLPGKIQELTQSKVAPATTIKFPSSPTIQHLLTRWLALDIVATVLPSIFAAPMMKVAANGVAVVMSNLPGPPTKLQSILGGYPLKDIVFWAPHRGYTGLGITMLSYDGMLHIGLMADDAVIPTQKGAQLIMDAILDELHSLRAAVSSSH
ncbi:uncharacterized protein [Hetaerina americana]